MKNMTTKTACILVLISFVNVANSAYIGINNSPLPNVADGVMAPPSASGESCTYDGKTYSPGSTVEMPGIVKICRDGDWEKQ